LLVVSGLGIIISTYLPAALSEIRYRLNRPNPDVDVQLNPSGSGEGVKMITPLNADFGIVIPKIGENSAVIPNVDPANDREYQKALTKGVAHARGTSFPGQPGNVFIFSHSSADLFQANRYNSVFYLLNKLESGDSVYLFYNQEKFKYLVNDKKIVDAKAVEYLKNSKEGKTLTLMTCWPPGTSLRRLILTAVIAP